MTSETQLENGVNSSSWKFFLQETMSKTEGKVQRLGRGLAFTGLDCGDGGEG